MAEVGDSPPSADLRAVRADFADALMEGSPFPSEAVRDAFARVPREDFLPPPPWRVQAVRLGSQPESTSEATDLYRDVIVSLDPARSLNNGSPGLWAGVYGRLGIAPGQRVVQVGAGTGYFSAVLAEIVGPEGAVTAVEVDPELATAARRNLRPWKNARVVSGDGTREAMRSADVVVVNAGATHVVDAWLDALAPGGRLFVPLTVNGHDPLEGIGLGIAVVVERRPEGLVAQAAGPIGIYPCHGARTLDAHTRLLAALTQGRVSISDVRSLRRDRHRATDTCWCHVDGACLSTRPPGP